MTNIHKNKNPNMYILDYLKAFAIIAVVITHCDFVGAQRSHVIFPYLIGMAVPVFMLITGFNYANSCVNKKIATLFEQYNLKLISKRLLRIVIPFAFVFFLEYFLISGMKYQKLATVFINGGYGPGSYYFPVMLQVVLFLPLVYFVIKKFATKGLFFVFFLEFLYFLLCAKFDINLTTYRILSFRYLSLLGCGLYFGLYKNNVDKNILQFVFLFGLFFLTLINYTNFDMCCYPYLKNLWNGASGIVVSAYIAPIFYLCCSTFEKFKLSNKLHNILSIVGKSSWHIFLFQMLYYTCFSKYFTTYSLMLNILINLFICLIFGCIFCKLETKYVTKKLVKLFNL